MVFDTDSMKATCSEFLAIVKSPFVVIIGLLGLVGTLVTFIEASSPAVRTIVLGVLINAILIALIIMSIAIYRVQKDEITTYVHVKKKGEISLQTKGIAKILQDVEHAAFVKGKSFDGIYCIVPANIQFDMDRISEGSAMSYIWTLLANQKICNENACKYQGFFVQINDVDMETINASGIVELLQARVEEELRTRYPDNYKSDKKTRAFPYGTCIKVNAATSADTEGFNLLFVVNSNPQGLDRLAGKEIPESVEGERTIDVMPYAFREIANRSVDTLIVPTIGTRYLGESVQSVVSSIVNRYITSLEKTRGSYKLIISLTADNIKKGNPSLNEIRRFTREVAHFYKGK